MKGDLSWIILVLSYSCSLVYTGTHAKSNKLDIKQVVSSKNNKTSEIHSLGKLPKSTLSKNLDFRKSRNQGSNISPLGNTTVEKHAKSNKLDIKQVVSSKNNKTSEIHSLGKLPKSTLSKSLDFRKSRNQESKISQLGNTTVEKHAKSNKLDIKQVVSSKNNKTSEIKSVGKLPKSTLSKNLDFRKSRNHGSNISPLGNTTVEKHAKSNKLDIKQVVSSKNNKTVSPLGNTTVEKQNNPETLRTTETPSSDKVNSSSINTTQSKEEKILRGHKAHVMSNQTDEHKDNKQNNVSNLRLKRPKIAKGSKHQRINEEAIEKRAKKLLVTFFDSELDDTENAKSNSRVNTTRKTDTTNNVTKNEHKIKNLNTTKNVGGLVYKRTKLPHTEASKTRRVLVPSFKQNQIIETTLPSGPGADRPQHVQVSNQPTHVMFKPVHKYYPAIHRYMTRPIHRFLNKPVNLGGLTPQLPPPQLPPPQHAGFLQVQQPGDGQAVQVRPMAPNVLPGARLVTAGSHPVQDIAAQMGPVRMFGPMTAGIQPVPIHPHRSSPTGYGPCTTNPCRNSGVCSSVYEQATCICRQGFRGKFCELTNNCYPNPCHNFGSCTELNRDFECNCKKGYRGKRCEVENKCEPNPCVNGGTCSEMDDDYVCTCREGYLGHSCEAESKCEPINPCKNGATCQEARDTYKCLCRDDFGGYNCEARITRDHCRPNPCYHGGFCTLTGSSIGNYTCGCSSGWKGLTCAEKVDNGGNTAGPSICESVNPCMFGGTCTPGSYYDYTCACPSGRGGIHCERSLIHEKPTSSCSHCHAFAKCLNNHCECNKGYTGNGRNCAPAPEFCHPNPCYNGGTCREPSSKDKRASPSGGKQWRCECPVGFSGASCQDMDPCHVHICQNGGSCTRYQGQAKCQCRTPYGGKYCEEKDVCHSSPCKNAGSCKGVDGVATCLCSEEYEGTLCNDWKCSSCDPNAGCKRGMCVCNNKYSGDGRTCRKNTPKIPKVLAPVTTTPVKTALVQPKLPVKKFCDSNPCSSGATCLEALQTYFCRCPEDRYGKQCEKTPRVIADLCSKCDIDATCKDGKCVCNEGFTGSGFNCKKSEKVPEQPMDVTLHKIDSSCDFCPDNGQCLNNVCVCPPGFENTKRSCVAIDNSEVKYRMKPMVPAIDDSKVKYRMKPMVPAIDDSEVKYRMKPMLPAIDDSEVKYRMKPMLPAIDNSEVKYRTKPMVPGIEYVGITRNRLPIGQWKEDSVVTEYKSLGCWADTKDWRNPIMRAVEPLEGLHPSLNDDYKKRENAITKCAGAAKAYGYKVFAVQNGGQCFSGSDADKTYTTYGPSMLCRFGVGGTLSNDVYRLS